MEAYHILLIEDDPAIGQSLVDGFRNQGYEPHLFASGGSGIEFARKFSPHLIVLDIRLPDGSGFDFCRQMRQMGLHQPISMLTSQHDEMDGVLGLELGADDYMTKPFSLRELISRTRAQLRRAYGDYSASETTQVLIDDLVLDQAAGRVQRGEETLNTNARRNL
jgi:DNA-binding response OmpR family regulator